MILTEFGEGFPLGRVSTEENADLSLVVTGGVPSLRVRSRSDGLSIRVAAEDVWDLSGHVYLRMDIHNPGTKELYAQCLINGMPGMMGSQLIPAGEVKTLNGNTSPIGTKSGLSEPISDYAAGGSIQLLPGPMKMSI